MKRDKIDKEVEQRLKRVREAAGSDIVQGDDGFWVFWPTENKGAWNELDLVVLALELNTRNEAIQEALNRSQQEYDL